ncbi:hypothetical protein QYF61_013953 [Mycteria americana]|uniref:Uncharacterized protein n=1 Tax=Mycteria americana TaxID=33587 RepID=A0AAN7MHH7_MYCAM|nr:hypothetical protein QYF61_013953 [Mycteria americana]
MIPRTASLRQLKEVLSFFYTILMLMVNPLLYSLRTREVKGALGNALRKTSKVSSWDMTEPIQPQQRAFPISSADAYTDRLREITQAPEGLLKVYCQKPQPMCISRNEMPEAKGRMVANGPPLVRWHVEEEEVSKTSLQEYQVPEMRGASLEPGRHSPAGRGSATRLDLLMREDQGSSFSKAKFYTVHWCPCPGFGSAETTRVTSVREDQGLPPCQTGLGPDSSKIDPPLAKTEPSNKAGGTGVKMCLRRGKIARLG